jgi:hypothetical protein
MKNKKNKFKHKKHDDIINDYDNQKRRHLEKLATKQLKNDETFQKLKNKPIDPDFLKMFDDE